MTAPQPAREKLTPDQQRALDHDLEGIGPTDTAIAIQRDRQTITRWRQLPAYQLALAEESAPMLASVGPLARRAAVRLGELMESTDDKTAHTAAKALFDAGLKHEDIKTGAPHAAYIIATPEDVEQARFRVWLRDIGCPTCGTHLTPADAPNPLPIVSA
jgi:hypothetical protein